jgi:PHD/YefM family antitoxin component YafN of YafNO toxin-antitoxin module
MTTIHKKIVVDEKGDPQEVIIPWKEFLQIEEALGLDLDDKAAAELREADGDMRSGNLDAFVPLDQLK